MTDLFTQFFQAYPPKRRGTVRLAHAAWLKAIKREEPEVILAGAIAYAASNPGIYSKGLPAWLNADGWAIDYTPEERRPDRSLMKSRYFDLKKEYAKPYNGFMGADKIKEMRELEEALK